MKHGSYLHNLGAAHVVVIVMRLFEELHEGAGFRGQRGRGRKLAIGGGERGDQRQRGKQTEGKRTAKGGEANHGKS